MLKLISGERGLVIPPTSGKKNLVQLGEVDGFSVDPAFRREVNVCGLPTGRTLAAVYELQADAANAQIYGSFGVDTERLIWQQEQICCFCLSHQEWLGRNMSWTFFLFEADEYFHIAQVLWPNNEAKPKIVLWPFSCGREWMGVRKHRIVIPQT